VSAKNDPEPDQQDAKRENDPQGYEGGVGEKGNEDNAEKRGISTVNDSMAQKLGRCRDGPS